MLPPRPDVIAESAVRQQREPEKMPQRGRMTRQLCQAGPAASDGAKRLATSRVALHSTPHQWTGLFTLSVGPSFFTRTLQHAHRPRPKLPRHVLTLELE